MARIKAEAISEPDNKTFGEYLRNENSTTVYFLYNDKIIHYKLQIPFLFVVQFD